MSINQFGGRERQTLTPDSRGLVARMDGVRHLSVRHESGMVLYRGDFPDDGILVVPTPARVQGSIEGFGASTRVWVGHGIDVPLSSYYRTEHGVLRPWSSIPVDDPMPDRWTEVEVPSGGAFQSDLVLPRGAFAVVAVDSAGAFAARPLEDVTFQGTDVRLESPLTPVATGTVELALPPEAKGDWYALLEPAEAMDAETRRIAVLVGAADPELGKLLTSRKAVDLGPEPAVVDRIPVGSWQVKFRRRGQLGELVQPLEVTTGAPGTLTPESTALAASTRAPLAGDLTLSDFCEKASNWSTTGEFTGVPGGADFVAILGMFIEDKDDHELKTYADEFDSNFRAWTVPTIKQLRCSSSDCKTIATISLETFPIWADPTPLVRGAAAYSPFLVGLSSLQVRSEGENYTYASTVNSGLFGTVMDQLKVYVVDTGGKSLPVDTSVAFSNLLEGPSPAYGAIGSNGYVEVRTSSGVNTPIYCVNTPDDYTAGMLITVSVGDADYETTCLGYTDESSLNACIVVQVDQKAGTAVCNPLGASCTP